MFDLHQGDCIHLLTSKDLFQVIGIDDEHERCWVRRWPLLPKGSPVFEISMQQIAPAANETNQLPLANS